METPTRRTMDFPAALAEVIKGRRITKLEWNNPGLYVHLAYGYLMIHKEDGNHQLLLSQGDLEGKDWVTADFLNG